MTFEITRGVTPPVSRRHERGLYNEYPFEQLEAGEMFFVPGREKNDLAHMAWRCGKKFNARYATKFCYLREKLEGWEKCKRGEDGAVPGIGVWRIE